MRCMVSDSWGGQTWGQCQVVAVVTDVAREPGFLSCTSKQLKRFVGLGQSGLSVFASFCSVYHSISHACKEIFFTYS